MDGTGTLFADFVSALGARAIVVSYPIDRALDYEELAALARRSLPADEPFILVGESFSGPIAIQLGAERVPGLQAIVLVCSFAKAPIVIPSLLQRLAASIPVSRIPAWLAGSLLLGRFHSDYIETHLMEALRKVKSAVWKGRLQAVMSVDRTSCLSRIEVPVLYLRASEDRVVFRSAAELISRHVQRLRIVKIEGPHFLLQAKPAEAAAAIKGFANECGLRI
jgi:pimeloyl-ACP methyl ester carboxylesterase